MKVIKNLALAACLLCPIWGWTAPPHPAAQNSNQHGISLQIRKQMVQIRRGLKSGQLTQEQARSRMAALKNIRQQELQYFHQNGRKEITSDQKNQLQQKLGSSGQN